MDKNGNEYFEFGDKMGTRMKVENGQAVIIRETFLSKKEIEISNSYDMIIRSRHGIGSIRRGRFLKQPTGIQETLTTTGISVEQTRIDSETLKKVLECETTEELEQKIDKIEIHETVLMGTLNALFSAMYIF